MVAADRPGPCLSTGQRLNCGSVAMRCRESLTAQAQMSPRGPFLFRPAPSHGAAHREPAMYRLVATAVGTPEALDLAPRLAAWHDAMVMHRRRMGDAAGPSCGIDCPHEQAASLWLEAVDVYGERARALAFLRTFGIASGQQENAVLAKH
jgi:hypothetical protein